MEDDDPMVSCPFDSGHRLLRSRMQYHLTRCSKNDPRRHLFVNKRQCDFDASHFVDKENYEKHLTECEAAIKIFSSGNSNEVDQTQSSILPVNDNESPTTDSWGAGEWADEAAAPSYNPQKVNENRALVQPNIGASKSQRRKHRIQQRRRINELTQNGSGSSN